MNPNIRWALRFWAICVVSSMVLIAASWLVFDFGALGLTPTAKLALSLGALFSITIGAGLMALVFYSARSGRDQQVRRDDER